MWATNKYKKLSHIRDQNQIKPRDTHSSDSLEPQKYILLTYAANNIHNNNNSKNVCSEWQPEYEVILLWEYQHFTNLGVTVYPLRPMVLNPMGCDLYGVTYQIPILQSITEAN